MDALKSHEPRFNVCEFLNDGAQAIRINYYREMLIDALVGLKSNGNVYRSGTTDCAREILRESLRRRADNEKPLETHLHTIDTPTEDMLPDEALMDMINSYIELEVA